MGIQAQRAVERVLRLGAPVRAQERHRDPQQGRGQIAPVLVAFAAAVLPLHVRRQTEELARVRGHGVHVALGERHPRQGSEHLGRLGALRKQPQVPLARVREPALRFQPGRLCRQRIGIGGRRAPSFRKRAPRGIVVAMLGPPAAQLDPDRRALFPEPIRRHQPVHVIAGALLRAAQPDGEALRHGFGGRGVAGGEKQAHQVVVRLRVVGLSFDGNLEVLARLGQVAAGHGDPRAQQPCRRVLRIEGQRGLQLLLRVVQAPLLDQHFRQDAVEVRRLRVVHHCLSQLRGGGREIVRVLRQQGVQVVAVGAGAGARLHLSTVGVLGRSFGYCTRRRPGLPRMGARHRQECEGRPPHEGNAPALHAASAASSMREAAQRRVIRSGRQFRRAGRGPRPGRASTPSGRSRRSRGRTGRGR